MTPDGHSRDPWGEHSGDHCGDHCVTCSDEAVAVTVVRLLERDLALVETGRGREVVSVALVEARAGDTILVHAKEAIAVAGVTGEVNP